jgi:hypothetical protein
VSELEIDVTVGPVRVIPVLATAVDVLLINGPVELAGFSFREAGGEVGGRASGNVTSPGATTAIATLSGFAAGTYLVNWTVGVEGTLGAGDANNMNITLTGVSQIPAIYPGVVGEYPQQQLELTLLATDNISVKSIAAATVGANYSADITIIPVGPIQALAELQDGNNPLAEVSLVAGQGDSRWYGSGGLKVRNRINLHMISGTMAGAVYARFQKNTG